MLQRIITHSWMRWLGSCLFTAGLLVGVHADNATAQSAEYCGQLQAQIAALGAGSRTNPQQVARYDNAIAAQQGELLKARDQASRAGCGTGGSGALCTGLDATIQRMSRNLVDLQQTRQRLGSSAGLQRERARLTAAMQAEGCSGAPRSQAVASRPGEDQMSRREPEAGTRRAADNGTRYRTLCVRMCDGFFFPISHNTPRNLFERDEKLCAARCPGTPVELHFHRFPGEESEEMVSVPTGQPYREGENAFRYRQASWERPANCGCSPERGFDVLAGGDGWQTIGGEAQSAPAEDDETHAGIRTSTSGSFVIQQPRSARQEDDATSDMRELELPVDETTTAVERIAEENDDAERRIRVVGPTFLPAPEEAIDLRSLAPDRAR